MTDSMHVRGVIVPAMTEVDIFIVDGRFSFEPVESARTILDGGFLIPGLVDAHAHLPFASPAPEEASWAEKARASAQVQLDAGILAVRDPGAPTPTDIGPQIGLPRTITGGRFLAAPGRMFPDHGQRELPEEQIPEAAEEEFHSSRAWVKLIGDFPGPSGRLESSFRPETLADAARRVHALGGQITVHALLPETIDAAIEAGFDAIEHGVMLRPEQSAEMAERGMALVPTIGASRMWPQILEMFGAPSDEIERTTDALARQPEAVRAAWEAGVTILAGTDAGLVGHGLVRNEVQEFIDAGIPAADALAAASWGARSFLRLPAIEPDAPADLVAFARNPLEDPGTLAEPQLIVLDGRVVGSGRPVRPALAIRAIRPG